MCANGGSSHCCQLLLYGPPKLQQPHKATLGRPTHMERGTAEIPVPRKCAQKREGAPKFSPGESLSLRCAFSPSFLPPRSAPLSVSHLALSLSLSLSLFCSLTNHPYLNVCNGIGLMPLHRKRGGGRDTGIRGRLRDGFLRLWWKMINPYFSPTTIRGETKT